MGRGDGEKAKNLLYGPRPQGAGPTPTEEEEAQPAPQLNPVPESVEAARDRLPLDDLRLRGIKSISIEYNGYGDSGEVHSVLVEPREKDLQDDEESLLSDFAYALLESRHPGWEINEGSEGSVKINLGSNAIEHNHYTNYVSQHHDLDEMALS